MTTNHEARARELLAAQFEPNGALAFTAMKANDVFIAGVIRAIASALTARDAELRELVTDLHKVAPDMNTAVDMADWVRDALLALVGKGEQAGIAHQSESRNPWQQAVDRERVSAHLGVAADGVTEDQAMQQLGELIDWHIAVATDPAVNGGFKLVPVQPMVRTRSATTTKFSSTT